MSNTNRAIVQGGLDRRANARRQRMTDAAHEAAERSLRIVINTNTQERRDATEAAQRHAEAELARQQRRSELKAACRAQEAEDMAAWNAYMLRVFGSIIGAALVCFCFLQGGVKAWVAIPCIILAIVYSVGTLVKYIVERVRLREESHG